MSDDEDQFQERDLPGTFFGTAFAMNDGTSLCYAAEEKTHRQFYVSSSSLASEIDKDRKRYGNSAIKIVVHRNLLSGLLKVSYADGGGIIGTFDGPVGGGPRGGRNFYAEVAKAHGRVKPHGGRAIQQAFGSFAGGGCLIMAIAFAVSCIWILAKVWSKLAGLFGELF